MSSPSVKSAGMRNTHLNNHSSSGGNRRLIQRPLRYSKRIGHVEGIAVSNCSGRSGIDVEDKVRKSFRTIHVDSFVSPSNRYGPTTVREGTSGGMRPVAGHGERSGR